MHIVLVEDDYLQLESISDGIKKAFSQPKLTILRTEEEFRVRFNDLAQKQVDLFILDCVLPWTEPKPNMSEPPDDVRKGNMRFGGIRCANLVAANEVTKLTPVILYSVIEGFDLRNLDLPSNVYYLQKKSDDQSLIRFIRSVMRVPLEELIYEKSVFLVHGHDEYSKEAVARFVEGLGLKIIILHEQPNEGRTIIEKFEAYGSVPFAVVLLTPDDTVVSDGDEGAVHYRARQNVIFELGFFVGKLGRQRVCALYKDGVEIPSDYSGVLFVRFDKAGAWRPLLTRELNSAGLPVDVTRLLR